MDVPTAANQVELILVSGIHASLSVQADHLELQSQDTAISSLDRARWEGGAVALRIACESIRDVWPQHFRPEWEHVTFLCGCEGKRPIGSDAWTITAPCGRVYAEGHAPHRTPTTPGKGA